MAVVALWLADWLMAVKPLVLFQVPTNLYLENLSFKNGLVPGQSEESDKHGGANQLG